MECSTCQFILDYTGQRFRKFSDLKVFCNRKLYLFGATIFPNKTAQNNSVVHLSIAMCKMSENSV